MLVGSDTIKASVLTGLGTRLQAFQNKELQELTNHTDIDLTLPGKEPCIYYVITSDMDSSRDFLVSLFFTFLRDYPPPEIPFYGNSMTKFQK